jgi:hypothetical protein
MEVEVKNTLPFLDILIMKRGPNLAMKVYLQDVIYTLSPTTPVMWKEESFIP